MSNALMVFVKNPVLGKVKTRLAKTIGDKKALEIYQKLLTHTRTTCDDVVADKFVFYSDFVADNIDWENYKPVLQTGAHLGEKMENAFAKMLNETEPDYKKAVVIGSDCFEITTEIIGNAFHKLNDHDIVIGPAADGGYYLLGMKQLYPQLFRNKNWSTPDVLPETITELNDLRLSYFLLPVLNDVDEVKDLAGTNLL